MTSRWAAKGTNARHRDEAVFEILRRGAITTQACPLRPTAGGTESIHLRCRNGSKGLRTQLSPSLLASGSILCRREVISFQTGPRHDRSRIADTNSDGRSVAIPDA